VHLAFTAERSVDGDLEVRVSESHSEYNGENDEQLHLLDLSSTSTGHQF